MKCRSLIVLVVLMLVFSAVIASVPAQAAGSTPAVQPQSVGYEIGKADATLIYVHDGLNYGISLGANIGRKDNWHSDALLIYKPDSNEQFSVGACLGYDFVLSPNFTVSPLVGFSVDVSEGTHGKTTRGLYGGSLKITF